MLSAQYLGVQFQDLLQALQVAFECRRPGCGPEHPRQSLPSFGGRLIAGKPVVCPPALLRALDEACLLQDCHVLRNRGGSQLEKFDNLADAQLLMAERHECANPILVAKALVTAINSCMPTSDNSSCGEL